MQGGLQVVLAALLVTTSACAHRSETAADPAQLRPHAARVSVNVVNNSQSAMEIYVVGNGTSYHLGTVAPGVPRSFELPPSMIAAGGHVQFLAQASGAGPRVQSDDVIVAPGDVVDFDIMTNLVGSRATVRP
jgi:hypothetical protein